MQLGNIATGTGASALAPVAEDGTRNRRVVLSAMREGVTRTGKPALYLEDNTGATVARLQLDTDPMTGSKFENQLERTRAILSGIGIRDEDGVVHVDRIPGLEVDLLEEYEVYEGRGRWSTRWISLPRTRRTAAFKL